jgi:4-amino-4-deoxy-L-arabinose transferase-like glycosyltransferase
MVASGPTRVGPLAPQMADSALVSPLPIAASSGGSFRARLGAVVAVAAAWRLVRLVVVKWDQPLLLNDSWYYSSQARQLTQGRWFREILVDHPGAEHGPLTSLVLAPLSWMDDPVPWQRMGTVVIGVVAVALVGVLGRRIGGETVGLVAAAIAAVYPNLWLNDGLVMSESLATLLVVAALLVLLVTRERLESSDPVGEGSVLTGLLGPAALFGLLVGLAALTRSELALFVPLGWIVLWRSRADLRRVGTMAVMLTAAAVLTVAPWTVFNLVRFENPVLLTTNDGTTLLGANCDETFDGPHPAGWYIGCVANHPTWDDQLEPSVRSGLQRDAAFDYLRDRSNDLPAMAVRRVARTFDLYAIDDLIHQDVGEEREEWAVRTGIVAFWLLAPLAAVGWLRVNRAQRDVLILPVTTTVVVSALFYGAHRFRTPMEPVVVVLAAVTLVWLWNQIGDRVRRRTHPMADPVDPEMG